MFFLITKFVFITKSEASDELEEGCGLGLGDDGLGLGVGL